MRIVFSFLLGMIVTAAMGQPVKYTAANIHAHNDYDHNIPFSDGHALGLGSIEADVYLVNDTLFVSHAFRDIKRNVMLDNAYLAKLDKVVRDNKGFAFADHNRVLQLLIDLKTDSLNTLLAVVKYIQRYPALTGNWSVRFVITGNQVPASQFDIYPPYILFDGNLDKPEHAQHLSRIGLFSANFAKYSKWKGEGEIPPADKILIESAIQRAHAMGKQIRFWGVPDNENTWGMMMKMGVDYINTDHIADVVKFVEKHQ